MIERIRDYAVIAWVLFSLLTQVWGLAQQTLIANSQAQQRIQVLESELTKARVSAEKK